MRNDPERARGPIARRLRHLPLPLAASAVLLVLGAAVGAAVAGAAGAAGAVLGVLVVSVSYALSAAAVAWADSISPKLVLSVGLASYLIKFSLLGVVLVAAPRNDWAGTRPMAVAMIAMIVVWVGAQIWWTVRARIPSVDLDAS